MKIFKVANPIPFNDNVDKVLEREELSFDPFDNEHLITPKVHDYFEKTYPNAQQIGRGSFGIVYDIGNDKVAKITTDRAEIGFLKRNMKYDFFPKIYSIKFFGKTAVIEMEKVIPITKDPNWMKIYSLADRDINAIKNMQNIQQFKNEIKNIQESPDRKYQKLPKIKKLLSKNLILKIYSRQSIYDYWEIYLDERYIKAIDFIMKIKKLKIDNDAHSGNIGLRNNGELVIFDIRNDI